MDAPKVLKLLHFSAREAHEYGVKFSILSMQHAKTLENSDLKSTV